MNMFMNRTLAVKRRPKSPELSKQQLRAKRIYHELYDQLGRPPYIREFGPVYGCTSTGSVHFMLRRIEKKGHLCRARWRQERAAKSWAALVGGLGV